VCVLDFIPIELHRNCARTDGVVCYVSTQNVTSTDCVLSVNPQIKKPIHLRKNFIEELTTCIFEG